MTAEQESRWEATIKDLVWIRFAVPRFTKGDKRRLGGDWVWPIKLTHFRAAGWMRLTPGGNPRVYVPQPVYHEAMLRYAAESGITPQWAAANAHLFRPNIEIYIAAEEVLKATLLRQAQLLLEMHNRGVRPRTSV